MSAWLPIADRTVLEMIGLHAAGTPLEFIDDTLSEPPGMLMEHICDMERRGLVTLIEGGRIALTDAGKAKVKA